MSVTNITAEDYKKQIVDTVRAKYDYLILGVAVLATLFVSLFEIVGSSPVAAKLSQVKMPQMNFSAPKVSNFDFDNIAKNHIQIPSNMKPTETKAPAKENGQISAVSSGKRTKPKNDTYEVKEGDSLASIAQEVYGDYNAWTTIAKANHLNSPDEIEVGMKLKIPRH